MGKTLLEDIGTRLGDIFSNGKFKIGAFNLSLEVDPNRR
jgi:hypothetical protein